MKILAIPDLHGRKPVIHYKDFDVIVCIGDIVSDKHFRSIKDKWVKYNEKSKKDSGYIGIYRRTYE